MPLKIFLPSLQTQLQTTYFQQSCGEDAGATNHDWQQNVKQNPLENQCVYYSHCTAQPSSPVASCYPALVAALWANPHVPAFGAATVQPQLQWVGSSTDGTCQRTQGHCQKAKSWTAVHHRTSTLPQPRRISEGFNWILQWFFFKQPSERNHKHWLIIYSSSVGCSIQVLLVQLHHGPDSKWNGTGQKTFCDWEFKVIPRDYTEKYT